MIKIKTKKKVVAQEEVEEVICDMYGGSCGEQSYDYKGEVLFRSEYGSKKLFLTLNDNDTLPI